MPVPYVRATVPIATSAAAASNIRRLSVLFGPRYVTPTRCRKYCTNSNTKNTPPLAVS